MDDDVVATAWLDPLARDNDCNLVGYQKVPGVVIVVLVRGSELGAEPAVSGSTPNVPQPSM